MLPAVPTLSDITASRTEPGRNLILVDPTPPPSRRPPHIFCSILQAARCWGLSPGVFRLCLILSTSTGLPVIQESARAVRTVWPPPSPREPSSTIQSNTRSAWRRFMTF